MVDLKKLQDAMNKRDVNGIARQLFQWDRCNTCESWANLKLCKAPGCVAVLCPECMAVHGSYHLTDETESGRPQ